MGSCFWSVTTASSSGPLWYVTTVCQLRRNWGSWVIAQLEQQKRIQPLSGFGFAGVAVKATRKHLLAVLSKGLRNRRIAFPDQNGPVEWPVIQLTKRPTESERCSGEVNVA